MTQNFDAHDCCIKLLDDYIEVKFKERDSPLKLNNIWLRENCRCSKCYSHVLNQRNINISDIPESIRPVSVNFSDNSLFIVWNNDEHISTYPVNWLIKYFHLEVLPEPILWYGDVSSAVTITESDLKVESKLADLVKSLLIYGIGFVKDVKPTIEATEKVVTSLFPVQRTFFGDMWEFSNKMDYFDSAYTNVSLGAHNDNTYFNDAAGLQVFHLLEHNGTGGETLLIDGFRAVKEVNLENPKFVDCLRNVSVESVYIDPNRCIKNFSPILHFHSNNQLKQIRFNLLDRSATMPMPTSEIGLFYKSLRCLASKINNKDSESWVKLQPGTVAFINNWRVLHGRASYTGYRRMGGCYVAMGEFLSKARILKIIV